MYARSTTMRISPQSVDDFAAFVRDDAMPLVTQLAGCVGLSALVDRRSGRCIVTSAWESEAAMAASEDRVRDSRERAAEMFAGAPLVETWEIAVMHRARPVGDGATARLVWSRTEPAHVDRVIDAYRASLMPWWEETRGFCSNSLMVNRRDGRLASTQVFQSADAMAHTRDQFTTLREEFAQRMGLTIREVAEFEVALAHLRVPETV